MATTATVTIGADSFTVYALTTNPNGDTDSFWNVRLGAEATAWAAASEDDQNRALVMAADWLDRGVRFTGTKTSSSQARSWPRDNATNSCTSEAVTDGSTPDDIFYAQAWLAGAVLVDNAAATASTQGSNIKSAKAGSAQVEFFRPTIGTGADVRLPQVAHDYAGCYAESANTLSGPSISGTSNPSSFTATDCDLSGGYA